MDSNLIAHIRQLQAASKEGRLVIFVGAGVSANSGVPAWKDLIKGLKRDLPSGLAKETDDLKVAQLYKDSRGHLEYMERVKSILKEGITSPNSIHTAILDLNPVHIITTNYDDLIEQEIKNQYKQYSVVKENSDISKISYPNALVKMHGDFESDNIVLTENDYFDYARNFALIRSFVLSLFASKTILFVGFSFNDINLKMILKDLQSILSEKMRRVYLLSSVPSDYLTIKYFENKGINILHIDKADIESFLPSLSQGEKDLLPSTNNEFGDNILYALSMIKHLQTEHYVDVTSEIYSRLKNYRSEIRVWGDALRAIIPDKEIKCWNYHSNGLQLFSPYFQKLYKELKSRNQIRDFYKAHPDIDFGELKEMALENGIYDIDGISLISSSFSRKYFNSRLYLYYFYSLNLKGITDLVEDLKNREVVGNNYDLELPFIYCKLGRYTEAYLIYERLLPIFWKKQKFILYFICLYNMRGLRHILAQEMSASGEKLRAKLNKIDLYDILNRLVIPNEVKMLFHDLLFHSSLSNISVESSELKEEIDSTRKLTERGGFSLNSNISLILGKYQRERNFFDLNYINNGNPKFYNALCHNVIAGVLNAYETDSKSTSIDVIEYYMIVPMIFGIPFDGLRKTFQQYSTKELKLDEDCKKQLINTISRLSKSVKDECSLIYNHRIQSYILNLLYVISRSDIIDVEPNELYSIVLNLVDHSCISVNLNKVLPILLSKYELTKDLVPKLIYTIIRGSRSAGSVEESLAILSGYCSKHGITSLDIKAEDVREGILEGLSSIYPYISEKFKKDVKDTWISKINHFSMYLEFIVDNSLLVDDLTKFEKLSHRPFAGATEYGKFCISKYLCIMRKDERYSNVHSKIDSLFEKAPSLRFMMSPEEFDDYSKINFKWITYCDESVRDNILSKPEVKTLTKQYIQENRVKGSGLKTLLDSL